MHCYSQVVSEGAGRARACERDGRLPVLTYSVQLFSWFFGFAFLLASLGLESLSRLRSHSLVPRFLLALTAPPSATP